MTEEVFGFESKWMSGFKDFKESSWSTDIGWFEHVLNHCYFRPRDQVEIDTDFKQLIPYVLFKSGSKYLSYEREGSESRLTGKISVGIGGHTNLCDLNSTLVCEEYGMDILTMAVLRELDEEISFGSVSPSDRYFYVTQSLERPLGYIYVDGQEVDKVHFGVVYVANLPSLFVDNISLLDEGKGLAWKSKDELLNDTNLENWSRIALQNVY